MERGTSHAELPDALASQSSLYSTKIPLLLYGDYPQNQRVSYTELKKLLESFFECGDYSDSFTRKRVADPSTRSSYYEWQ